MADRDEYDLPRKLLGVALGALAAKMAILAVEQIWTRGLHQELPFDEDDRVWRRIVWIGLTAAAVGMARELARELANGPRRKI